MITKNIEYTTEDLKGRTFLDEKFQGCKFTAANFRFSGFENCRFEF